MTHNSQEVSSHLHCSAIYSAEKATEIAATLNADERDDDTNFDSDGNFVGFEYRAEIKDVYGKVAAFQDGEFVGYF